MARQQAAQHASERPPEDSHRFQNAHTSSCASSTGPWRRAPGWGRVL
ncbi:MAG: hypothetical protein MZU91_14650 [Desulfosudis oleivorans]|nr:hypothetical protein [Desulfosudis oleivorans]